MIRIETDRLILKTIDESDANLLSEYYQKNFDFLKPWMPVSDVSFFTVENLLKRISNEKDLFEKGLQISLYAFTKVNMNRIIGNVTISNIIRGCFQNGFLGYQFDKEENGKGYAAEAVRRVIGFAFSEMKLHRIEANTMVNNTGSIKLLERLNFVKEGFSKNYLRINGKWEDHFRYAVVNDSYIE